MEKVFNEKHFGKLLPLIKTDSITDIVWTGRDTRVEDLKVGTYVSDIILDEDFVEGLCARLSDFNSKPFNSSVPKLEAWTSNLRITCIDKSRNSMGTRIQIRKTEARNRIVDPVQNGYCHPAVYDCIKAFYQLESGSINLGQTGSGKTEWTKFTIRFIDPKRPITTIEDSYELRLGEIEEYIAYDITGLWVDDKFTWQNAIAFALRNNAKWIMLAEARGGAEMREALIAASTGHGINLSLHTNEVKNIPGRVRNMGGFSESEMNDFFTFFDFAVNIEAYTENEEIKRHITQLGVFDHDDEKNENKVIMLYDNGQLTGNDLPSNLINRLKKKGISNPLTSYLQERTNYDKQN